MATTYYIPSSYGAADFNTTTVSTTGIQNFSGSTQAAAGSYTVITDLGNTGPGGALQYSVTLDYTGPGTGTTLTTTQTVYSDANHSETYGEYPIAGGGTAPAYFIITNGPVTATETTPYTYTFGAPGSDTTTAYVVPAGAKTTDPFACFASGTLIRTSKGAVRVENLAVGDLVVTLGGAERRICWLGHQKVDCRAQRVPHDAYPIRIAAHAFGDNRPARDLFVSPGHAICVDVLGEVLIPAGRLVNGSTITQVEVDEVTYWHVELDSHDVILAENLAAESYLDMGNRGFFREADVADLAAGPDADVSQRTHADFCRPVHASGPLLDVVRAQLRNRAQNQGWSLASDLELHLEVDGRQLDPVVRGLKARFHLPANAREVWLVSPTGRPSDTVGSGDRRDLGLNIRSLQIDDGFAVRDIAIRDPRLSVGFHEVEGGVRRWTSGRAKLPAALWEGCEDGFYLRVELADLPVPRWTAPAAEAATYRPHLAIVA